MIIIVEIETSVFPKYTGKNYLFEYYIKDSIFFFHLDQVFA